MFDLKEEDSKLEDHPRIRGTNIFSNKSSLNKLGSSPHTRDKSFKGVSANQYAGIIPAYAGQIAKYRQVVNSYQDHPRIRGTNKSS